MSTNKTQAEQLPQVAVMQSVLKAYDLRIGNKILFLGDVVTFKNITEFREDGIFWIKTFEPKIESKNFHFKPIPLTEEILLKCGFELKGIIFRINNGFANQFDVNYSLSRDIYYYDSSKHGIYKEVEIKYLHELQNLYWCLCGQELTIKTK